MQIINGTNPHLAGNQSGTARRLHGLGIGLLVAFSLGAGATAARAQDTTATLSGTIKDATGAVVPGAKVTLINAATKFKTALTANDNGEFQFPNLTPGKYDLDATMTGFKEVTQTGISLDAAQQGRANVTMEPGSTEQVVEVEASVPDLNYTDPTLSGSISPETLQNFPLVVSGAPRSSVSVATMLPGVTTGGGDNAFNARFNGGLVTGDEAIVDGATVLEGYMNQSGMVSLQTDFGMSPDITSEVTVLTANYDAQYGNTTSAQLVISTKSGGDTYHGAIYEYFRNEDLNAFQYGVPKGTRKPEDRQNDYGASLGGFIPGLHRGHGLKGYFYFNYEGFKQNGGATSETLSIPSLNARSGNFSGIPTQLYYPSDPTKFGADAGTPIAYGGARNQINPAYEDSVAKSWFAALPTPTASGEVNNYLVQSNGQGALTANESVYFGRFDFTIGPKDHAYYTSWWQRSGTNLQTALPVAVSTATPADPENAQIQRINWEHNFSATTTNHATLGYLNRNEGYFSLNGSVPLATVPGVANTSYKPEFTFDTYTTLGAADPPTSAADKTTRGTWAFNDVVTKVIGSHSLKAGFEYRLAGTSIHLSNNQGGTFAFTSNTTGNSTCPYSGGCPGNSAASFYLGAAQTSDVNYYNVLAVYPRQYAYAAHIGDTWRVTQKLTVDYSMRWDLILPFKEKYNHLSFFNPNGLNPGAVTSSGTELKGSLAFAGSGYGAASYGANYPEQVFYKSFAPRLGFAYSLSEKTVIRAGYGIYFGQAFYPGWSGGMSEDGFNKTFTSTESASGSGQVPALYLQSGISSSAVGPTQNISAAFDNGQTPSLYRPLDGNHRPYSSQYNLTVERQLPDRFALQVSYVGTKGSRLPSALNPVNTLNPISSSIQALGSDVNVSYLSANGPATFAKDGVAVPYTNWASQMTGCAPTLGQALLPFPQYCGSIQGLNEEHGASVYQSAQGKLERRFSHGLYLLGTLTYSKLMTDASDSTQSTNNTGAGNQGNSGAFSPFDPSSRRYAVAADNVPVVTQLSAVYELPFGRGKQFMNKSFLADLVAGGWQVSPLYRYEYGTPFSFYSSNCATVALTNGYYREQCVPAVTGSSVYGQSRTKFNPATGVPYLKLSALQTNFTTLGNTGTGSAVSDIYGPSYKNWDISIAKSTRITERFNFKLYANMFNAFNNHSFIASQGGNYSGPSTAFVSDVAATSGGQNIFGTWNGSVSAPRTIQFAGRIEF